MIRDVAYQLLERVEMDDAYANLLLPKLLSRANLDPRDAGFVQELSFGVIRNKKLYDAIISAASGRDDSNIDKKSKLVLRLGTHQLLAMRVPKHAAIYETVEIAKEKLGSGAVGFVNAVLRKVAAFSLEEWIQKLTYALPTEDEKLSLRYSHPLWIVKALKASLASRGLESELEHLLEADNVPAPVSLVTLPGLSDVDELIEVGGSLGRSSPIAVEYAGNPTMLIPIREGRARVQDQGSQLVALALVEAEIETKESAWLDLCAGPGGKSALLASKAKPRSVNLHCIEVLPHRAKLVREALFPFGDTVKVEVIDGRNLKESETYTRILLDAPCTGLGALRRRPEARWRKGTNDLKDLTKLQKELFQSAWNALKPGGVLAYVTCSPHLSETTAVVAWAESKFKGEYELLNANRVLNAISPNLNLDESLRTAQLWPHRHGTDAMFLAIFRKSLG